jgi:undecaprenyl-diphosphatase
MSNTSLFFAIYNLSHQSPLLDGFMIFCAVYLIYLMFLATLVYGLTNHLKERKVLALCLVSLGIALIVIEAIRVLVHEPRPFVTYHLSPLVTFDPDLSFPSKHATISSVVAFSFLFHRSKLTILMIILALLVAVARVFVGVHYPLDVLAGICVAYLSVFTAHHINKRLATRWFFES